MTLPIVIFAYIGMFTVAYFATRYALVPLALLLMALLASLIAYGALSAMAAAKYIVPIVRKRFNRPSGELAENHNTTQKPGYKPELTYCINKCFEPLLQLRQVQPFIAWGGKAKSLIEKVSKNERKGYEKGRQNPIPDMPPDLLVDEVSKLHQETPTPGHVPPSGSGVLSQPGHSTGGGAPEQPEVQESSR